MTPCSPVQMETTQTREQTYKNRLSVFDRKVFVVESQDGPTSGVKVCGMGIYPVRNGWERCHKLNVPKGK